MFAYRRQAVLVVVAAITAALATSGCSRTFDDPGNAAAVPVAPGSDRASTSGPVNTPTPSAGPTGSPCRAERVWGTAAKRGSLAISPAALYMLRVGKHTCYDRVVFDINGPEAVGFAVRYVPMVRADGSGQPVPAAGRAVLEVVVTAPIYGSDNQGHQPWRSAPNVGDHLIPPGEISGWRSLAAVTFAGSFEGQTTIAVGVQDRRPFRVSMTSDPGYTHVVLDIAH